VRQRTGGRLDIKIFWGSQISNIREAPQVLGSGIVETGMLPKGEMFPDLYPYTNITTMPFWGIGDLQKDALLQQYAWKHPLVTGNFTKSNVRYGFTTGPVGLHMNLAKRLGKIEKAEELNGLQVRGQGYVNTAAQALGMIPVNIKAYASYQGLEKGMIDVNVLCISEVKRYKMYEVCDYLIDLPLYVSAGAGNGMMNLDKWNSLPQYIKDIWADVETDATAYANEIKKLLADEALQIMAENGMKIYKLAPEEEAKVRAAGIAAWEKWVSDAEKSPNGLKVKEFISEMITYRESLTGEPWMGYRPFK